jgi:hypothetical protein
METKLIPISGSISEIGFGDNFLHYYVYRSPEGKIRFFVKQDGKHYWDAFCEVERVPHFVYLNLAVK